MDWAAATIGMFLGVWAGYLGRALPDLTGKIAIAFGAGYLMWDGAGWIGAVMIFGALFFATVVRPPATYRALAGASDLAFGAGAMIAAALAWTLPLWLPGL